MTVMPNFEPNPAFATLASDEVIARTILALGPRGITAEVVADADCVVLLTPHATFLERPLWEHARLIVDTRNAVPDGDNVKRI